MLWSVSQSQQLFYSFIDSNFKKGSKPSVYVAYSNHSILAVLKKIFGYWKVPSGNRTHFLFIYNTQLRKHISSSFELGWNIYFAGVALLGYFKILLQGIYLSVHDHFCLNGPTHLVNEALEVKLEHCTRRVCLQSMHLCGSCYHWESAQSTSVTRLS